MKKFHPLILLCTAIFAFTTKIIFTAEKQCQYPVTGQQKRRILQASSNDQIKIQITKNQEQEPITITLKNKSHTLEYITNRHEQTLDLMLMHINGGDYKHISPSLLQGHRATGKTYFAEGIAGEINRKKQDESSLYYFGMLPGELLTTHLRTEEIDFLTTLESAILDNCPMVFLIDNVDSTTNMRLLNKLISRLQNQKNLVLFVSTRAPQVLPANILDSFRQKITFGCLMQNEAHKLITSTLGNKVNPQLSWPYRTSEDGLQKSNLTYRDVGLLIQYVQWKAKQKAISQDTIHSAWKLLMLYKQQNGSEDDVIDVIIANTSTQKSTDDQLTENEQEACNTQQTGNNWLRSLRESLTKSEFVTSAATNYILKLLFQQLINRVNSGNIPQLPDTPNSNLIDPKSLLSPNTNDIVGALDTPQPKSSLLGPLLTYGFVGCTIASTAGASAPLTLSVAGISALIQLASSSLSKA